MSKNTLSITDNRTGKTYEIPVENDAIKALDLRQIKVKDDDFGLLSYDPAFQNTASTKSNITFIDGDVGILEYRGYPIDQLAEQSTYLETTYLLLNGELPNAEQLENFKQTITLHTFVHENFKKLLDGFHHDAHPMAMLGASVAALSTFYPTASDIHNPEERRMNMIRLIAKMATLAAMCYRHSKGLPYVLPDNDLTYPGNFLSMVKKMAEPKYAPHPVLERALDVLFILHADHEQNCSANAIRNVGSSQVDPFCAASAAISALFGPLHGGANEEVLHMLDEIGSKENIPAFIKKVKEGKGAKLMGFGHRVYKNYDPRAKIIKKLAYDVFQVTGTNPMLDIALELEHIALEDEYFVSRKLYPNVDFYSGLIYQAMGFPMEMFTVLFAIGRTAGWMAQWEEMLLDKEQKIARPRQIYQGHRSRDYVAMIKR